MKISPRTIGCGVVVLAAGLYLCLGVASLLFDGPLAYAVDAEFRELPNDDTALKQWLEKQNGLFIVHIVRDGNLLHISWGPSSNNFRAPISQKLRDQFEQLGYKGMTRYSEKKSSYNR